MNRKLWRALAVAALISSLLSVLPASAHRPAPDGPTPATGQTEVVPLVRQSVKPIDQPNPKDLAQMRARQRLLEAGQTAEASALAQTGTDRVLVILVEFAGTDVFTWTAPITPSVPSSGSTWDPKGIADPNEYTGAVGNCSKIITQTKTFTYTGPLHNTIERPRSAADRSGESIWTPDFNKTWFTDFMFGNGVVISYTRQDASPVYESFTGQSVNQFYSDLSSGTYTITGDVIGWLGVPHSTWYYDADQCPGARSGGGSRGVIPGAGNARTLVTDALKQVNAISNTIPSFNWANYDTNSDGIIDRLWIVHAGYGEEDATTLLNRVPVSGTTPLTNTFYGEAAVWSHSSAVTPPYSVTQNIAAGAYIAMPENGGIGVFAHEYGHNLGADDLYSYGDAETSAGFWTTMADDWTGYPIGFEPPAPDPWHLDNWGWLNPMVITDATKSYTFNLGQASRFTTNTATPPVYRGAKIQLADQVFDLPVAPLGSYQWWGGNSNQTKAEMTTKSPIPSLPAGATLVFSTAYGLETEWDFMWVQVSTNGGTTWNTLTNTHTTCAHDPGWVGGLYGFPDDLCGAGLGGFTDYNANFPDYETETFDLAKFASQNILLRFSYMTDWGTVYEGPFVDNVKVMSGTTALFSDGAESGDANWTYVAPWGRYGTTYQVTHNFYLQWRNTNANGGYDSALGDPRWRYGPANTGLLVWYNNNGYVSNDVWNPNSGFNTLADYPGFGPKARMLVVDSHPEPYREPAVVAAGYNNEGGNVAHRSLMRDAPFTLQNTVGFTMTNTYPNTTTVFTTQFAGKPAVSKFNDALGYYPGAENVPGGPVGQTTLRWMTKQWDASVVMPSKEFYGIKAPGYNGTDRMRFECGLNAAGQVMCYSYAAGLGYTGGNGNPGDVNGQYGWQVELVEEAPDHTWATVKVYNQMMTFDNSYTPASVTTPGVYTVTYKTVVKNEGSGIVPNVAVTYTLDPQLNLVSMTEADSGTVIVPIGSIHLPGWSATDMWPGSVVTLTVVATGTASTPTVVSTRVDAFDGVARGPWSEATAIQVGPDLRVTKSGPTTAKQGDVITYTLTFSNAGNMPALNVWVTDTLPAGVVPLTGALTSMFVPVVPVTTTVFVYPLPVMVTTQGVTLTNRVAITAISPQLNPTVGKSATWNTIVAKIYKIYLPVIMKN